MKRFLWLSILLATTTAVTATLNAQQEPGHLHVKCKAGFSVYLDGELRGVTSIKQQGLVLSKIAAGEHQLKLLAEGAMPAISDIIIDSGQVFVFEALSIPSMAGFGQVIIQTLPLECQISSATQVFKMSKTKDKIIVNDVPRRTHKLKFSALGSDVEYALDTSTNDVKLFVNILSGEVEETVINSHSATEARDRYYDPLLDMIFVKVPAGEFMMGSDGSHNEQPRHKVKLSSFYLGETEVTQAQWRKLMGNSPSNFSGDNLPVDEVSWDDVQAYMKKAGARYSLPSEAQWEYACRAGTTTKYYAGELEQCLDSIAWYYKNAGRKTHEVGLKQPNAWGLFDMTGNVWEWCGDWYDSNYYATSPTTNPTGPASGSSRVVRGGSWGNSAFSLRCADRTTTAPAGRDNGFGFRVLAVH